MFPGLDKGERAAEGNLSSEGATYQSKIQRPGNPALSWGQMKGPYVYHLTCRSMLLTEGEGWHGV